MRRRPYLRVSGRVPASKALAAALAFVAVGAAPAPTTAAPSLWRLDCGTIEVGNLNDYSDTYQYVGQRKTFTDSCYLNEPELLAVHRLSVDAWAVQHPGDGSRRAIQSVGLHLARLMVQIEDGLSGDAANSAMLRFANAKPSCQSWVLRPRIPSLLPMSFSPRVSKRIGRPSDSGQKPSGTIGPTSKNSSGVGPDCRVNRK